MKKILRFIFCKLLKIHKYTNEMNEGLYAEGWNEFYRCKLCGRIKTKYMIWNDYEEKEVE